MSAQALHLNLLNPLERQPSSSVSMRYFLPVVAAIGLAVVTVGVVWTGLQLMVAKVSASNISSEIARHEKQNAEIETLKAECQNLQATVDQYAYYLNGRQTRGDLLRRLALVIPQDVTLTALSIPSPPDQALRPPPGVRWPVLQGPTQTVERVELRLTGLARDEKDVFQLMKSLKEPDFTNSIVIAENAANPEERSPRVLAFRQETAQTASGKRGVFFDLVYTLTPREFAKP